MHADFPYSYVAVEGNIGAGKTTFCQLLADTTGCSLVLEQFTDNPFLPFFYEQPERYAFPVELFFMTERHKQLQEHFSRPDLFRRFTAADYFFVKTLLFARNNLHEEEFRLFQRLYGVLNNTFPRPDLLLYLHRPVDVLLRQIRRRGRPMESGITGAYLESIQNAYFDYFKATTDQRILVVDLQDADFRENAGLFSQCTDLLAGEYPSTVQYLTLRDL